MLRFLNHLVKFSSAEALTCWKAVPRLRGGFQAGQCFPFGRFQGNILLSSLPFLGKGWRGSAVLGQAVRLGVAGDRHGFPGCEGPRVW